MKYKVLFCAICVVLFSCKKDNKKDLTTLYPITFNINGFSQSYIPIGVGKLKTAAVADTVPVQNLYYSLYNNSIGAIVVNSGSSIKGDAGFGSFTDSAPPGNYIAVFIGGSSSLIFHNLPYDAYFTYSTSITNHLPGYWGDTFYKRIPVTVTQSGVKLNVILDRVTAKLDLVIKDPIPTGTSKITVAFSDTVAINSLTGVKMGGLAANGVTKDITTTDVGKTNYLITMNTIHNSTPFDVTVSYYGANSTGPISSKVIKNVVCKTNTRTTLSGNLFTAGNGEFSITVNQSWNAPETINF